ncbi:MAG: tetratricopeptide repeat protein [Candidatus Thorarchaeota archaeon]
MAELQPKSQFDYFRLAKSYEQAGKLKEALEAYSRAIEIADDYAQAWYYKAQLHLRMGQFQQCIDCALRAQELQPQWSEHIAKLIREARSKS